MSDNIDYAELDKAVNEAVRNRSAGKTAAPARPVAKPAAAVHHSHGQFMDFVSVQPRRTIHSASIASKPVTRPVAQSTTVRPVARPVAPAENKITTAPHPAIVPRSAKIGTSVRPVRPSVSAQIQQKQQAIANKPVAAKPVAKPVTKPVAKPIIKTKSMPVTRTALKPVAKPVAKPEAKPVAKPVTKTESKKSEPNANNYSLGVRSPFMTNTKVEKRPLGKDIPETSTSSLRSTKNIYSSKSPSKARVSKKHTVTEAPKKHSGWLWTLVVLFVIAAGAGFGYLAYVLVFAK